MEKHIPAQKHHLNLSFSAYNTIESDLWAFQQPSLSGFLNLIFRNYWEHAAATLDQSLGHFRRKMERELSGLSDSPSTEEVVSVLVRSEQDRLLRQALGYPKGKGFKFYLNVENSKILEEESSLIREYYSGKSMRYFKAVLEEYASRSPLERERILFRDTIECIQKAIDGGLLLRVESGELRFEVKPYEVLTDHNALNHYLVGWSVPENNPNEQPRIASFLISRISRIRLRPKSYRSGRLTRQEQEDIALKLRQESVQFLLGDPVEITLRLTEEGLRRYKRTPYLRPQAASICQSKKGALCVFHCTPHQAERYFFAFGPDAELLSPESLRDTFRQRYRQAAERY